MTSRVISICSLTDCTREFRVFTLQDTAKVIYARNLLFFVLCKITCEHRCSVRKSVSGRARFELSYSSVYFLCADDTVL